jgi:class 3 adenylate cyclase
MVSCQNCGADLRPGAKFCDQCGAATASSCGSCGAELRSGAKFCDECGASQTGAAPAVAAARAASAPITERKVTSVLFGDLVAFTTLSEQHDKEDVRDLLSQYFAQCRQIVGRYGGTIEKFIGDAVMAVWGVPTAHEDDAERAVRAGLELVRAVEALGEELALPGLAMRVGIVTGEVAVTVGAEHEGMVAGDAVNTAARVQSVASSGEVWVDETTRLLTSGAITYVEVGSHQLKGKAEPVPLWAVRAVVAAIGGAQRADGLEAPLTGRGRELRVIKELFHGVEESGRPALVVLQGDAGFGKSRLAWEFFKYIDGLNDTVIWHSTRCLAYGDGIAFWPIAEAVRGRVGLVEADTDADPASALDEWLRTHVPDGSEAAWLRARVLALLGRQASGGIERDDLFAAWQTFFERAGHGAPVAIVVDDAQHADEGTIAFLEHLLANSEAPIFLMLMSRPGLVQRWPDLATNRRVTMLHLAALDNREMATLVEGLVNGLPEDVRDGLVERAQGVPLYAIETVRSLIDRDLVVPRGGVYVLPDPAAVDLAAIGAPASLHALVAARLDGLPSDQRRVIADASVLGATFTRDSIAALAADVRDLGDVLTALTRAEILGTVTSRLSAEYGQYRFVQDVVRQVAYSTLSRRDRKARHLAVATYFETLPDAGGDFAPVIAQHYLDAITACADSDADVSGLRERVIKHLEAAAARARALGAPVDAVRYLDTALENTADDETAARLHLAAGEAALDASQPDPTETHARAALDYFESAGDALNAGAAAAVLAMNSGFNRADNTAALDTALPHWNALQGVPGAEPVLLRLSRAIASARLQLNEDNDDITLARIALADSIGDRVALGETIIGLAISHIRRAPSFALMLLRCAAEVGQEAQRPTVVARALMNTSIVLKQNDLVASREMLDAAREESRKIGVEIVQVAFEALNRTSLLIEQGELDQADEVLATIPISIPPMEFIVPWLDGMFAHVSGRARRYPPPPGESRNIDDEILISSIEASAVYDALANGDLRTAVANGVRAVDRQLRIAGLGDDLVHFWPVAMQAAMAADDADAISRLLAVIDEQPPGLVGAGLRAHRLRFAALLAIRGGGAGADPEQSFRQAIAEFERWGSSLHAARCRAELAGWLDDQGRADEAATLRQEALVVLQAAGANGWLAELGLQQALQPTEHRLAPLSPGSATTSGTVSR